MDSLGSCRLKGKHSLFQAPVEHHCYCLTLLEQSEKIPVRSLSFEQAYECPLAPHDSISIEMAAGFNNGLMLELLIESHIASQGYTGLWLTGHVDRAMENTCRRLDKPELVHGEHWHTETQSWRLTLENWKPRLLHVPIKGSKVSTVRLLIELGAGVQFRMGGQTPLHTASFRKTPSTWRCFSKTEPIQRT